jgi:alkylation response protein AidB-like acyl-CoA dehydrogenase
MAANGIHQDMANSNTDYQKKWSALPTDEAGWLQRAQEVADVLAVDAGIRDRENKSPTAEIQLLKHAGLLKVLGPKKYGGGEQPWSVGYKTIRKIAEADGYVGQAPSASSILTASKIYWNASGISSLMVDHCQCRRNTGTGRPAPEADHRE